MKKEKSVEFAYDKLTENEYTILRYLKRRNKSISNKSKYKIYGQVITCLILCKIK